MLAPSPLAIPSHRKRRSTSLFFPPRKMPFPKPASHKSVIKSNWPSPICHDSGRPDAPASLRAETEAIELPVGQIGSVVVKDQFAADVCRDLAEECPVSQVFRCPHIVNLFGETNSFYAKGSVELP